MSRSFMSGRQCSLYCPFVSPRTMMRWRTRIFRSEGFSATSVPQQWFDLLGDLCRRHRARVEPEDLGSVELLHPAEELLEGSAIAGEEAKAFLRFLALGRVSLGAAVD